MEKKLEEKIKAVGRLLAQSMLDQEVKKALLRNAQFLTEADIDTLAAAFEKEQASLAELEEVAKRFGSKAESEWKNVANLQRGAVKSWLEESH